MGKGLRAVLAGGTFGGAVYWGVLTPQQRCNMQGASRSILNSSRAALVLFRSVRDYQVSLDGIEYNTQQYHQARHQVHLRVADRILQLSKTNKGIYLKLGQYLGNLQKVVPWEFTHVLKVLQDSAPPVPYQDIKVVIENDLSRQTDEIFASIRQEATASASLAQVHKATLKHSGQEVALKIQYPFLRQQSEWDLLVLGKITQLCNYLLERSKSSGFDLPKLFKTWTQTLVEELDFGTQLEHATRTKQLFRDNPYVYIPHYYTDLCSSRLLVMQFVKGVKINDKTGIQRMGIDPQIVGKNLISIFTEMIFKHRHIHCDAHPGNLFVRKQSNALGHDIVLLDHGLYRQTSEETMKYFSGLWISLMVQDKTNVLHFAEKLNIHEHLQYLPLIFLYRSRGSSKRIGAEITGEERAEVRRKDLANFDSINQILQNLPPELMFVIRASNLVAAHNTTLGGNNRDRLFTYTRCSLGVLYPESWAYWRNYMSLLLRVWIFETLPALYRIVFGTLER